MWWYMHTEKTINQISWFKCDMSWDLTISNFLIQITLIMDISYFLADKNSDIADSMQFG